MLTIPTDGERLEHEFKSVESILIRCPTVKVQADTTSKGIISVYSKFKFRWDFLISILAVYNCTVTPYLVSFAPEHATQPGVLAINLLVDSGFIADLVLAFRTSYLDSLGFEVLDRRKICLHTLKNSFVIQLFSSIPIELISVFVPDGVFAIWGVLIFKIIRFSRLGRLFLLLRTNQSVKLMGVLSQNLLLLLVYVNFVASAWSKLITIEGQWTPLTGPNIDELEGFEKFVFLFYNSTYTLLGVELYPTNVYEYLFASTALVTGALVTSHIIAHMLRSMFTFNRPTQEYNSRYDRICGVLRRCSVGGQLRNQVFQSLSRSFSLQGHNESYAWLLTKISPSLRRAIIKALFKESFDTNRVFEEPEIVRLCSIGFKCGFYLPEAIVIQQNTAGRSVYFMAQGRCIVEALNEFGKVEYVKTMKPGAVFGEVALIFKTTRTASVHCMSYSTIAHLSSRFFRFLMFRFADFRRHFHLRSVRYKDKYRLFIRRTLRSIPYFRNLNSRNLDQFSYSMERTHYIKGTYLFREGKPCTQCFIVLSGKLELSVVVKDSSLKEFCPWKVRPMRSENTFRLILDYLELGSVLNPITMVIGGTHQIDCKVLEPTDVFMFDVRNLQQFYTLIPLMKMQVVKHRTRFTVYNEYTGTSNPHGPSLDYTRCCAYDPTDSMQAWQLRYLFKKAVLFKIFSQRRSDSVCDILVKNIKQRVKAAQNMKSRRQRMVRSLMLSTMPPRQLEAAYDYLLDEDIDRVSIYRFASSTKDLVASTDYLKYKLVTLLEQTQQNNTRITQLRDTVDAYKHILASLKASLKPT